MCHIRFSLQFSRSNQHVIIKPTRNKKKESKSIFWIIFVCAILAFFFIVTSCIYIDHWENRNSRRSFGTSNPDREETSTGETIEIDELKVIESPLLTYEECITNEIDPPTYDESVKIVQRNEDKNKNLFEL